MDKIALLDVVCSLLLIGHAKGSDNPIVCLNRCVTKAVQISRGEEFPVPRLSARNVDVVLEERRTDDLRNLSNRPQRDLTKIQHSAGSKRYKKKMRLTKDIPIIIASFRGEEYLVDGNRRINYSIETERALMQAYVLYVR